MSDRIVIDRRKFLKGSALAAAAAAAAACGSPTVAPPPAATSAPAAAATKAPAAAATSAPAAAATAAPAAAATKAPAAAATAAPAAAGTGKYKEAPMLTELVKSGKLPAIEQRLPEVPFVVGPGVLIAAKDLDWQPGKYGGTMHFAHAVANWNPDIFIGANENLLSAPGIGLVGLVANVVKDFKVESDNKVFTFLLRKGLKWSDGKPVTTEDVRFVYEDIYKDEKITPIFPAKFRDAGSPTGTPMKLEIVDDFTFRITFGVPYGGFLREISVKGWQGYTDLLRPSHVLKPWHIKYTPIEKMADELKKATLTNEWWQLFNLKNANNWDLCQPKSVGYPVLYPWVRVASTDPNLLTFERNPYYYKVDNTGQQLPYADKLASQQVNDTEMVTLKVLNGDVDYVRESTALKNLPLYKENAAKASIQATLMDNHVDPTCLFINMTYDDPTWRKVTGDVRFRQAISHGINRKEIIDNVYFGFAQMPKLVPSEYDVAKANSLLDAMGMDKKDAEGFRLGPDGKPFVFAIEHAAHASDIAPATELVVQHLKKIFIKATVKQIESGLWGQRGPANQFQGSVIWDVQPMWADGTWTDYIGSNQVASLWNTWYTTGGKQGEEPPAAFKELYTIQEGRVKAVPGSDEDKVLVEKIYKNYAVNVWIIPLAEKVNYAMVSSTKLGNMPKSGQAIGADYSMEQFYFK